MRLALGFVYLFAGLGLLSLGFSSPGDDLEEFDECKFQCEQITCFDNNDFEKDEHNSWEFDSGKLSLGLRLLSWDCIDNCDYQCQRIISKEREAIHEQILQFHGKWPFLRVFGIQELASTIFSLGNLVAHSLGFLKLLGAVKKSDNNHKILYVNVLVACVVAQVAWICSTIFHIRDLIITERLDYFLAGLTVLSNFHLIASRLFRFYLPEKRKYQVAFSIGCGAAYVRHLYVLITDWSYTYNMRANIACGILQTVCLYLLCFNLYNEYYMKKEANNTSLQYVNPRRTFFPSFYLRSPKLYSLYPLILSTIINVGMSLEIFDFPPVFFDLVDAHSLWHLTTIFPVLYGWYDWMIWDININVKSDIFNSQKNKEI